MDRAAAKGRPRAEGWRGHGLGGGGRTREHAIVLEDLRHIVDVVLLRVAVFLAAAVVLAPLVAHAYARVWPRRWRELRA